MFKCKLADLVVCFDNKYPYLERQCVDFLDDQNETADIIIEVSEEEIQGEQSLYAEKYSRGYLESVCAYRNLCLRVPKYNALVLHASVISYKDRCIALLAKSGVGKTTHTMLWKKVFGEEVKIINGDKPIVRFFDGVPFAYGTPWAGKEGYYSNDKAKLTDICFIERGVENFVSRVNTSDGITSIMQQVLRPKEPEMALNTLMLVEGLLKGCNLWTLKCNIKSDAAVTLRNEIMKESIK